MSYNTFGHMFRFTSWGESHGPAIGCVIDGCPPGLALSEDDIQPFLERRRPGRSKLVTQRQEADKVKILSGVFEGQTTGTPISLLIENTDQRSNDYADLKDRYRPGHADLTYDAKYGVRDYRGGGRASARETAMRVAAGAVARKILGPDIRIQGALVQMGAKTVENGIWDDDTVHNNQLFCPDASLVEDWEAALAGLRKAGNSVGGVVEVRAHGVPAGWGAPVYAKLDQEIAGALMSINAAKGVEIGAGFKAAEFTGLDNADEIVIKNGQPHFLSNHAGGILGGISNGDVIMARVAIKPTSSILRPVRSITKDYQEIEVSTKGRHDPCVAIRAVPVAEAMLACVLADQMLLHRGQIG